MNFTLDEYAALLGTARSAGYEFAGFDEIDGDAKQILLRHDIDYGPRFMREMARLETEAGAFATYCVQVDSPWYRLDEPREIEAIHEAIAGGHRLGLHFDASRIENDDEVVSRVAEQAAELERLGGAPVRVVSFHMPGRRPVGHLELGDGLVNAYSRPFFERIGYASDSNQNWRGVDVAELIAGGGHRQLQLLIHPFWWRDSPGTLEQKMRELARELEIEPGEIVTPEQWALIEAGSA